LSDDNEVRLNAIEETLAQIVSRVEAVDVGAVLAEHIGSEHWLSKEEIDTLLREFQEHHERMDSIDEVLRRVVTLLDGEEETDLFGNVTSHSPGLRAIAERNSKVLSTIEQRTNGGVTVTTNVKSRTPREWSRSERIAAASLAGFLFFSALPGIVITVRWIAQLIVESGL
jgi:hypothetical protein